MNGALVAIMTLAFGFEGATLPPYVLILKELVALDCVFYASRTVLEISSLILIRYRFILSFARV